MIARTFSTKSESILNTLLKLYLYDTFRNSYTIIYSLARAITTVLGRDGTRGAGGRLRLCGRASVFYNTSMVA